MLTASPEGVPVLEPRDVVRRRLVMTLGVALLVATIALLMVGSGSNDRVVGSGSTLVQPLVEQLASAYQQQRAGDGDWVGDSASIDYEPVGSLGGIMRLEDAEVDFAVVDFPLSFDELERRGAVQFPLVVSGIAVAYNLGDQTPALRLSGETLASLLEGRIRNWNDPAIVAENPGVSLPDTPVTVIFRADGSGSTYTVTDYLARTDSGWASQRGRTATLQLSHGEGVKGSAEMARRVLATSGAVGYLDSGLAARSGLAIALLRNEAGEFVAPTVAHLRTGSILHDASDAPLAYPMVAVSYVVMKRNNSATDNERALRFLSFVLDAGAQAATTLGYLPLPAQQAAEVRELWSRELQSPGSARGS